MHSALLHSYPTTDSNTGMMSVTLNMPNRQGILHCLESVTMVTATNDNRKNLNNNQWKTQT